MYPVTIEQFQKFTNVEELVLQKMKEQGPKIYEANYKHRHKHCKVIYKSFYDSKTRNKTFRLGLTMKPMPQSFKAKFLLFKTTSNNAVETSPQKELQEQVPVPSEPIPLEEKYKDDKPSTSSAFFHKPRFGPKAKSKQKLDVPSSKNTKKIYPKSSTKSTPKTRQKKFENQLPDSEAIKITSYFNTLELRKTYPETKIPEPTIEIRKRKSDPHKENTEQEPETKRPKVYPAKKKDTQIQKKTQKTTQHKSKRREIFNSDDCISDDSDAESNNEKENPTNQLNIAKSPLKLNNDDSTDQNKIQSKFKPRRRIKFTEGSSSENSGDGELKNNSKQVVSLESPTKTSNINLQNNPEPKSRRKQHSVELMSNNCDINANIEIIDLSSQVNKSQDGIEEKRKTNENKCSPKKSPLPKRNKSEEYINASPITTNTPPTPGRLSKDYIKDWIEKGQRALEDNNCDGDAWSRRNQPRSFRAAENIAVSDKLQTLKTHSENVKQYIKYWLKFEIQIRKGDSSAATVLSESSKTKIASAFSKMTFDDFKNLTSAKKHTSCTSNKTEQSNKSIAEDEENLKNLFTAFIKKEKPWPDIHIELAKLQLFFHAQGIKGPIQLKDIPPRILSFNEVLEKTNIKECISLKCKEPPKDYTQLLSLCKNQYKMCCIEGIWVEGLKLNDKKEENESSQEMSVDLFTESMTMASLQMTPPLLEDVRQDDNIMAEIDVVSKDLQVSPNLENASKSNTATKEKDDKTQKQQPDQPKSSSTKDLTEKQQKRSSCRPKSKRKNSLQSDDDLDNQMNEMFSNQDQCSIKSTIEPLMDNEELRQTLSKTQSQTSQINSNEIPICENTNFINHSVEKVVEISPSHTKNPEMLSTTNQVPNPFSELSQVITPNILLSNEERANFQKDVHNLESKEKPLQLSNEDPLLPANKATRNNKPLKSQENLNLIPPSPNIFASSGESDPKCTNSEAIEVQTQESVYVPCEHSNNNFQTEQNNFSLLSTSHENESQDPFGDITPNQEDTIFDGLQESANKTRNSTISEEISTEANINPNIVLSTINVSAELTLDLQGVTNILPVTASTSVNEDVEASKSKESSLEVPEDSVLNEVNIPTEPSINSHNPAVATSETIQIQEEPKELESRNSLNSKDISDSELCKIKNILGFMNVPIEPTPQLNTTTVDAGLVEMACNQEEISMRTEQLAELEPNDNRIDKSIAEVAENRVETTLGVAIAQPTQDPNSSTEKETTMEEMQSKEMIPSSKTADENCPENADNLTTINQTKDPNTAPGSPDKGVQETDLNTSVSSGTSGQMPNVKREILTQSFSQYDDDVQIIELPQSETVIIDDEETAPELLRALLCRSPKGANHAPTTTVHVSYLTPSSSCLFNFPQAQRMPSNFELTQSQSTLNQSTEKLNTISPENTESLCDSPGSTPNTAQNQKSNRKCQGTDVAKKSPKPVEVTKRKKKTPDFKQKLPPTTSKPIEQSQPSETSDITYVSIIPQNIPSDIEFTQTSLNKSRSQDQEECSKAIPSSTESEKSSTKNISGEAGHPGCPTRIEDNRLTDNMHECTVPMVVCLNEDCGESNKESMDLGQSKNTKDVTKTKENLGSDEILDSAPLPQCKEVKEVEALEFSNHASDNDRDYVECQEDPEISLDRSSDVEFLEESCEDNTEAVESCIHILGSSKASLNVEPSESLEDKISQLEHEPEPIKVLSTKVPNKIDSSYISKETNETSVSSLNLQIRESSLNESSSSLPKDPNNDACEKLGPLSRQNSEENATTLSPSITKDSCENKIEEYNPRAASGSQRDLSEGKDTQKNNTESETYSQYFQKLSETSRKDIVTSTQLEIAAPAPVENHGESLQAFESSHDSSVMFIDSTSESSENEDEEKFSKTAKFAEHSSPKTSGTDSCCVGLQENSKDGSECIVSELISPCVAEELSATVIDAAKSSSLVFARNLEASTTACKETSSSNNPCYSALSKSPEVIIRIKQNLNDGQLAKDSKTIENERNLQKSDLENQSPNKGSSNNSSIFELVESSDEEDDLENRVNEVIKNNDNQRSPDNIPAEASTNTNFSPKSMQTAALVEKTLNENENNTGTDALVIDQKTTDEHQGCTSRKRTEKEAQEPRVDTNITHNLQNPFEINVRHLYRGNKNIRRRRTMSETAISGLNQPSDETALPTTKAKTFVFPAYLPISTRQANQTNCDSDFGKPNENNLVEVPFMIDRNLLQSLPFNVVTLEQKSKEICPTYAISVSLELKFKEQQKESMESPKTIPQDLQMSPTIPRIKHDAKSIEKSIDRFLKTVCETEEDPLICRHSRSPPHKRPKIPVVNKIKRKLPQACKKKTSPKKSSKLPDFVPQKTHAFPSLPLAAGKKQPQNTPATTKQPSLLTIEECDYIIEDASLPMPTTTASQILGTDCTYFENSELLRNLDTICIPHHPDVPALQIEQLPPPQPTPTSSSSSSKT